MLASQSCMPCPASHRHVVPTVFSDGLLDLTYIMDPASKDLDIPKLLRFMTDPRGPGGAREILQEEVNCYGTLRCKEVEVTCESGLQVGWQTLCCYWGRSMIWGMTSSRNDLGVRCTCMSVLSPGSVLPCLR